MALVEREISRCGAGCGVRGVREWMGAVRWGSGRLPWLMGGAGDGVACIVSSAGRLTPAVLGRPAAGWRIRWSHAAAGWCSPEEASR